MNRQQCLINQRDDEVKQLTFISTERDQLRIDCEAKTSELRKLSSEFVKLRDDRKRLQEADFPVAKELETMRSRAKLEIGKLNESLLLLQTQHKKVVADKGELESRLHRKTDEQEKLIRSLREEIERLQTANSQISGDSGESLGEIKQLKETLLLSSAEKLQLEAQVSNYRSEIDSVQKDTYRKTHDLDEKVIRMKLEAEGQIAKIKADYEKEKKTWNVANQGAEDSQNDRVLFLSSELEDVKAELATIEKMRTLESNKLLSTISSLKEQQETKISQSQDMIENLNEVLIYSQICYSIALSIKTGHCATSIR